MFVFMLTWIFSPRNFSLSEFRVRNVGLNSSPDYYIFSGRGGQTVVIEMDSQKFWVR
jgi:hypothetical protein